ncbi:hypothetical protein TWF679_001722 [Orbilia oligospora]|uniref:F-box domain-containing protein n=1 Tax=Orbilia oligospora TaxID=2813651 RepID=A0A8H8UUY6_ORBOL|nr:hypothetical protein TWF679_001722 [Orbilia oligospora]
MYPPAEPAKRRITRSKAAFQNPKSKSQTLPKKQSQKQSQKRLKQLSPIVPNVWVTPADAYGSLNVLPAELRLMIFDYLTPEELKIFTSCSKHYYSVYLPLRFQNLTVALNSSSAEFFQTGVGEYIQSVRFGRTEDKRDYSVLSGWLQVNKKNFRRTRNADDIFSDLRAATEALKYFPNLRKLSIKYEIPGSAENNAYLAVLKNVPYNLETLEFQIIRFREKAADQCYKRSRELYDLLYSKLSAANQKFLGKKRIPDDDIDKLVISNSPKLPNLKTFKLSANCLANPMLYSQSNYFRRTGFYYLPLLATPQVENLCIETTDTAQTFNTYGFIDEDLDDSIELNPKLLEAFSRITNLELTAYFPPIQEDFARLIERFPNLKRLDTQLFPSFDVELDWSLNTYADLVKLKGLQDITLPWLRDRNGDITLKSMELMCRDWRNNGLSELSSVRLRKKLLYQEDWRFPNWAALSDNSIVLRRTENNVWEGNMEGTA